MISLLTKTFIKNGQDVSAPGVKRAYAALSSAVGIVLNLFLCVSKIVIGSASNSIAILGDGLNNLSDAGTSLVSLLGFKIAGYGGGSVHPLGHGRIDWIMGIFTSVAVLLMGAKLADSSAAAITSPGKTIFSPAVFCSLKQKYHCDCYIQVDYLIKDKALAESLTDRIYRVLQKFGDGISIDNFRLIESSPCTKAAFDLIYPAKMQKNEEEVITEISSDLEAHVPQYYASVKGIIRREYFSLHGNIKSKSGGY